MSEILEEAKAQGWVPIEEWKGDPAEHRSAEEFVERGNKITPILKERKNKKIEEQQRTIEAMARANATEIEQVKKKVQEQERKYYEEKIAKIKAEQKVAVSDGNVDEWQKLEEKKESIKPPEEPPTEAQQAPPTPRFTEWKEENEWYEKDEAATMVAMGYAAKLKEQIDAGTIERLEEMDFYNKVTEFVKSELPHKFQNPNRDKPSMAESGHDVSQSKGKGWNDIPPDAKAIFKRQAEDMKRRGHELDRDQWVKDFFEE